MAVDNFCLSCNKTFNTLAGLSSHARAKRHTANPYVCEECELSFASSNALDSHMNSPRHQDGSGDYILDDEFYASVSTEDGKDDEPFCNGCERWFGNMFDLNQHLAASPKHNWCFECSRDFKSEAALFNHQNSLAHQGRDFKCPFCDNMFKSPSGIALHIEFGCHRITRHQVTAAVHTMKIIPDISIKRITGPARPPTTQTTYIATEASFNGSKYQCYLCSKSCHTLSGLNSHLNSAAHDDDEFRCPKCKTEFKLISGFIQHIESRSCGLAENRQINSYFNGLTDQFSRLLTA